MRHEQVLQKVSVIVEGKPNQLHTQGMQLFEQYDEFCKYFAKGKQEDNDTNEVQMLHDLSMGEYVTDKYALWLDFRTINGNILHRMGRMLGSAEGGITTDQEESRSSWRAQGLYLPNHGCPVEHSEWSIHFCCVL